MLSATQSSKQASERASEQKKVRIVYNEIVKANSFEHAQKMFEMKWTPLQECGFHTIIELNWMKVYILSVIHCGSA